MIQLLYTQLRYDIEQQTYQIAELRLSDNPDLKGKAQIDESQQLSDLALRYCEEGVALLHVLLREKLAQSTPVATPQQPSDDSLPESDAPTWDFTLTDPTLDEHTLATLMHKFVVAYCLWHLSLLHFPQEAAGMKKALDTAQSELEDTVFSLNTPRKHRPPMVQTMPPHISIELEQP